jgi:hypothetical protein
MHKDELNPEALRLMNHFQVGSAAGYAEDAVNAARGQAGGQTLGQVLGQRTVSSKCQHLRLG